MGLARARLALLIAALTVTLRPGAVCLCVRCIVIDYLARRVSLLLVPTDRRRLAPTLPSLVEHITQWLRVVVARKRSVAIPAPSWAHVCRQLLSIPCMLPMSAITLCY